MLYMKGNVVAKKKASKKKASAKNTSKKIVKKVSKTKAPSKKKTAKKTVKKAAKKIAKKAVKKTPAKKTAKVAAKAAPKKVSKKPVKASPKKAGAQASRPSAVSSTNHLLKSKTSKKIDVTGILTPLDNRVVVRLQGAEKMTAGGLYIPDTVADVSGNLEGEVVAVGRGRMNKKGNVRPMDLHVGDKIVFSEYSGTKVVIENEDLIILREEDVMGVVAK